LKEYENAQSLLQETVAEVERYHIIERELRAWEEAVAARESNLEREVESVRQQAQLDRLELAGVKRKSELCTGALDEMIFFAVRAYPDLAEELFDPYVEWRIEQGFNLEEIYDAVVGTSVEKQVGEACRRVEERQNHDSEQLQSKKSGPKLGF
jgi:DNA-binding Lrp family transcriptional regulator